MEDFNPDEYNFNIPKDFLERLYEFTGAKEGN